MKMLLRHKTTGLYLQQSGNWAKELAAAFDFVTSQQAIDYIRSQCLTDVQVVAVFVGGNQVESITYQMKATRLVRNRVQP